MDKDFTLIQTARPQYFASGLSESHPHATQKGQGTWIGKVSDPDREATGFSVEHLPKSSVITPGGREATGFSVEHLPKSSVITPGGRGRHKDTSNYKGFTRKATGFSAGRESESTDHAT